MKKTIFLLSMFGFSPYLIAAELPTTKVGPWAFIDIPIEEVLTTVAKDSGVKLSAYNLPSVLVSSARIEGSLADVVKKLSEKANLSYSFNDGVLKVTSKETNKMTITEASSKVSTPNVKLESKAPIVKETWSVTKADKTASSVIKGWAKKANRQVLWEVDAGNSDVTLDGVDAVYTGNFESALEQFKQSLASGGVAIKTCYYPNLIRLVDLPMPCAAQVTQSDITEEATNAK